VNTTLNRIREYNPCANGWRKLLAGLGKTEADDEPLSLITILDINGLDDAIWALRAVDNQAQVRRYAVWCARQVQHRMTDPRSLAALDIAERHADGAATDKKLAAAWAAARAAAEAAWAAWAAARAAAEAAWAAWAAARAAAGDAAAEAAAAEAAWAAWAAAWAAWAAAGAAAGDAAAEAARAAAEAAWAAWAAARQAQEAQFRIVFGGAL